jgi:bacteriorhodopsin
MNEELNTKLFLLSLLLIFMFFGGPIFDYPLKWIFYSISIVGIILLCIVTYIYLKNNGYKE